MSSKPSVMITAAGVPVADNENSLAPGTARRYLGDVAGWIIVVLGVFAIMVDLLPV